MKKIVLTTVALIALIACGAQDTSAKGVIPTAPITTRGIGPATAGSTSMTSLPRQAQNLINKLGLNVVSCEREYDDGGYDVKTSSGLEIEFNSKGKLTEIDIDGGAVIGADVVKEIVPKHLYDYLKENKLDEVITSIEAKQDGYVVEYIGQIYNIALFNKAGEIVARYYND